MNLARWFTKVCTSQVTGICGIIYRPKKYLLKQMLIWKAENHSGNDPDASVFFNFCMSSVDHAQNFTHHCFFQLRSHTNLFIIGLTLTLPQT